MFPFSSNKYALIIFSFSFIYSVLIALFIQKYLIPNFFPSNIFIAGKELNLVVLDSIGFHQFGLEIYEKLKIGGIAELQIFYKNNFMPSILGFFYYIFYPDPVVLLPFNALIHAVTSLIIYKIMCLFYDKKISFFSTLIFVIYPQALEWTSQIHKDGIFCLGIVIFIYYSILSLENLENKYNKNFIKNLMLLFLLSNISILLIYLTRSYYLYFLVICSFFLIFLSIFFYIKDRLKWEKIIFYILSKFLFISILIMVILLGNEHLKLGLINVDLINVVAGLPVWQSSPFPISYIDSFMYRISLFRYHSLTLGGTIIDNMIFKDYIDFILYFPKAFFNGLFSPLPRFWYGESSSLVMSYAKNIMGFMTIFSYLLIFVFIHSVWKKRFDLKFLGLLIILIGGICLIGYSCVNTGTLLRYRYIFYILIICFGLSVVIEKIINKSKKIKI